MTTKVFRGRNPRKKAAQSALQNYRQAKQALENELPSLGQANAQAEPLRTIARSLIALKTLSDLQERVIIALADEAGLDIGYL